MIGIYQQQIETIPCLTVVKNEFVEKPLPLVVYFHGFTSAKEHNLDTAYFLADKGFRVVLPDSLHHGERENNISKKARMLAFWDTVIQNVKELQIIKEHWEEKELILDERISVAGTSMGGITTAATLTQYPWIKTAGILMGSPKLHAYYELLIEAMKEAPDFAVPEQKIEDTAAKVKKYDLSMQMETLNNRPLLFWHGEKDMTVPMKYSYSFYEEARKLYDDKEEIQYIKDPNSQHKVSRQAKLALVHWFEKYL